MDVDRWPLNDGNHGIDEVFSRVFFRDRNLSLERGGTRILRTSYKWENDGKVY